MTNATRYLCAAAYLDPAYAGTVLRELLYSNRAVAPSVGVDLGPVIRHCLRARNIQLARDAILSLLLLIGLFTDYGQIIPLLILCYLFGFLPSVNWARKPFRNKVYTIVGSFIFVGFAFTVLAVINIIALIQQYTTQGLGSDDTFGGSGQAGGSGAHGLLGPALLLGMGLTQLVYTYVRSRTLCDQLGPDAKPGPLHPHGLLVESRIAQVEGAQQGNLVLYSGENPFIGTGERIRAWSIAIELRSADPRPELKRPRSPDRDYVTIDPVELHEVIRHRLLQLKDRNLPPNEQLQALTIRDHIVGLGQHRWDSPLIDPATSTPYSEASPEAVTALIRNPQAGIRHYQRVSVCDEGQPVWSGDRKIIDGSDQDISASAFVHAAVEGHMFYLEFVSAAMPPVNPRWHIVDLLPKVSPGRFFARVLRDAVSSIFRDLIYAPIRAVRALAGITREGRSPQEQEAAAQEYIYGSIGARISVRELGATSGFLTYIQELDAEKYTKLTERLITDTVLEFLADKGVDTTAYASGITNVIDRSVTIGGNNYGPVAGEGGTAKQANQARQAQRAG